MARSAAEHPEVGRGNVGMPQQVLAENLAPLEFGGRFGRTEHAQPGRLQGVDRAGDQRHFRTDHGEPDLIFLGEFHQSR